VIFGELNDLEALGSVLSHLIMRIGCVGHCLDFFIDWTVNYHWILILLNKIDIVVVILAALRT